MACIPVAAEVLVLHDSLKHVCDGFEAPVNAKAQAVARGGMGRNGS